MLATTPVEPVGQEQRFCVLPNRPVIMHEVTPVLARNICLETFLENSCNVLVVTSVVGVRGRGSVPHTAGGGVGGGGNIPVCF